MKKDLKYFFNKAEFKPTKEQEEAILFSGKPLLLTAGPGSGKTRVLLWRTLNLLAYHNIKPEEIFLSTFTDKAAHQLKDGLRSYLAMISNETGRPFDISKMALGTVHSICNSLITNRIFSPNRERRDVPKVMDALDQYLFIYNRNRWRELIIEAGFEDEETAQRTINVYLGGRNVSSRHDAAVNTIRLFNRFSEEHLTPSSIETEDENLIKLVKMYELYLNYLSTQHSKIKTVDLSLLQQHAYETILSTEAGTKHFKHIIIDEYQDTNSIQEKLFFELAKGNKNICVVGDDDQALYRFRGATVENLVEFKARCKKFLGVEPKVINLVKNFRSKNKIVEAYNSFIQTADWKVAGARGKYHRIHDKVIIAHSTDKQKSVAVTSEGKADVVCPEVVNFILELKRTGKITDYNQVAFLFPAVKDNAKVRDFKAALEAFDIPVYAPRAGRFLEVEESKDMFGLFAKVFGKPPFNHSASGGMRHFQGWVTECAARGEQLIKEDKQLKAFVEERQNELNGALDDFEKMSKYVERKKWKEEEPASIEMVAELSRLTTLSEKTRRTLGSTFFRNTLQFKERQGNPFALRYVMNRVTSVDWSVLDLFYQLCGFQHFKKMIDLADKGVDEGPICNLGLITQYLSRYMEKYPTVITARIYKEDRFVKLFFNSYLYALYRLQESEYEDEENPFPKGRIPFLTIHQAKGLEFPVVVLGSLFRGDRGPDAVEVIAREHTKKKGEPLDKIGKFDNMRLFYVGLSRAQNLLILPRYKGQGQRTLDEFKQLFKDLKIPELKSLKVETIPEAVVKPDDLGKNYSFTGDYLFYQKCPRQYMIFKQYGFVPSRSQTQFFGSLVHQTIEDLHNFLISQRQTPVAV